MSDLYIPSKDESYPAYIQTFDARISAGAVGPSALTSSGFFISRPEQLLRGLTIATRFSCRWGTPAGNVGFGIYLLRPGTTDLDKIGGTLIVAATGTNSNQDIAPTAPIVVPHSPFVRIVIALSNGPGCTIMRQSGVSLAVTALGNQSLSKADAVPAVGEPMPATILAALGHAQTVFVFAE